MYIELFNFQTKLNKMQNTHYNYSQLSSIKRLTYRIYLFLVNSRIGRFLQDRC